MSLAKLVLIYGVLSPVGCYLLGFIPLWIIIFSRLVPTNIYTSSLEPARIIKRNFEVFSKKNSHIDLVVHIFLLIDLICHFFLMFDEYFNK